MPVTTDKYIVKESQRYNTVFAYNTYILFTYCMSVLLHYSIFRVFKFALLGQSLNSVVQIDIQGMCIQYVCIKHTVQLNTHQTQLPGMLLSIAHFSFLISDLLSV